MENTTYLTNQGYEDLKNELHQLKSVERKNVANAIAEAREKGDLSENAEYDAAKEAQGLLELKIGKLEQMLANSKIIREEDLDLSQVYILSKVRIKNKKMNMEVSYRIVSAKEANLKENKISVDSPIAKALLGKKVGEIAVAQTPNGPMELEILEISR